MLHYCYSFGWSLKISIGIWCENGSSGSTLLRCATVRYPSTDRSKYSNCTVNPSKYGIENQGMHFHHHRKARLIHCFGREQIPLLTHVIQCRIWWNQDIYKPSQTRLTQAKRDLDNPTRFNPGDKQVSTTRTSMTAALSWIECLH